MTDRIVTDHARRVRDIDSRDIEHAALAGEGILHVHDDDGRFFEIDVERIRSCVYFRHENL